VVGKLHPPGEKTLIVEVGLKGQHVGVLGAFKKQGGGFDFEYQLVPLGEEYIAPAVGAPSAAAKTLDILENYSKAVKDANLLGQYPRAPHRAQILAKGLKPPVNLTYVGTAACAGCHAAEFAKWKATPHSNAMNTLVNIAKRPSLRQFDGECVKCHTVGFDHDSGYVDAVKTPKLSDVGCESCHGPGSGHVANPKDKDLLALLSQWKPNPPPAGAAPARLPDLKFMDEMAKLDPFERGKRAIAPADQQIINAVSNICMKCHDHESDPHFDLYKNWPKVYHTGLAPPKPAPGGAPPGK
jgi:hypothetical protein